jgi:rare lipoprotein A
VTNLDNGRSVIVKINDRGPYSRGPVIDLSPRAADALDMERAGVAAVVIEPLVDRAAGARRVVGEGVKSCPRAQTKEAGTDMFHLQSPRHTSTLHQA